MAPGEREIGGRLVYPELKPGSRSHLLWIITLAGSEFHTGAAGAGARAKWTPGPPVAITLEDIRGQPHTVPLEAVLEDTVP